MKKLQISLVILFTIIFNLADAQNNNDILIPYRKGDKWGYCDTNAKIIIAPIYDEVDFFGYFNSSFSNIALVKTNGKQGLINTNGKEILPLIFDKIDHLSCGKIQDKILRVRIGDKYGLVTYENKAITKMEFSSLEFDEKYCYFVQDFSCPTRFYGIVNNNYYTISAEGKKTKISKKDYDEISEGVSFMQDDAMMDDIDHNHESRKSSVKIDSLLKYGIDSISNEKIPNSPFYKIYKNGKVGACDKIRYFMLPQYDEIKDYNGGGFLVILNEKYGLVNIEGKVFMPYQKYDSVDFKNSTYLITQKNNLKGIYMIGDRMMIQPIYQDIAGWSHVVNWNYVLKVRQNNKWGYISDKGIEYFED